MSHSLSHARVSAGCVGDSFQDVAKCVLKARVKVFLPGAPGRSGSYHVWRIYWAKKLNAESHLRAEDSVTNTKPLTEDHWLHYLIQV